MARAPCSRFLWCPVRRAFLVPGVHPFTADTWPVSAARHARLLAGQASGRAITSDSRGRPRLADPVREAFSDEAIRREGRRRILAIASLARQSNDNALIAGAALQLAANGSTTIDTAPALARRAAIDAIREAAEANRFRLAALPEAERAAFVAAWPEGVA